MHKKCEKTFEILRSEITFLMDLYFQKHFVVTLNAILTVRGVQTKSIIS